MAIRNFSSESFGAGGGGELVPRQKFNFTLVLSQADGVSLMFTRVSSVTAPGYSFDTQIMNQYNNKRVVQTRLNYDPITVTFYDTFDNQFHDIMRRYIKHYYNGTNGLEARTKLEGTSTVDPTFITDMGFTPNAARYFFPRISIVQNGLADQHRETVLINPMIINIQGDTLDYSDSQPVMYTVTLQPESIQTLQIQAPFDVDTTVYRQSLNLREGGFGDAGTAAF